MQLIRKGISVLLTLTMCITMLSVSNASTKASDEDSNGLKYAKEQQLNLLYNTEATTLCSFAAAGGANDWQAISNCVEGLVSVDEYGNKIPGLAESWTVSDDGTVYTFKLREGLQWVDHKGKEVGELTAEDFLVVAKFICEPDNASPNSIYFDQIIKGATEYLAGETTDFDTVGFKAPDKYTVEITLEGPLPYFISYGGSYLPAYAPLLDELGDKYGIDNESMYFIGPYIMTTFEPQSRRIYVKNEAYYEADKVYIEKITMTYNAEADTLAPEMFIRGETDRALITTAILDEYKNNPKTSDYVIPGLPDTTYMYYYGFNFDPQFDAEYEPENWTLAVNNENFRQSLYWALNRHKALLVHDPYNPELRFTNSITPIGWCDIDGTDFTQIGPMKEITERANNQYDEKMALEYKEKAIEELTEAGATFPIKILMPYNPASQGWDLEVQIVKQQLTELLGEDYIDCIIEAGPSTGFLASVRREGKYAFMKLNNGSTIDDPNAWTPAFYKENSWTFLDKATGEDTIELVEEYYELVDEARSIMTKSMERYETFAEAEAFLLNHALVIPFATDTDGYYMSKYLTLEGAKSTDRRFKGIHVLEEPLTEKQFLDYYENWLKEREESLN